MRLINLIKSLKNLNTTKREKKLQVCLRYVELTAFFVIIFLGSRAK